jgi:CysZ protein
MFFKDFQSAIKNYGTAFGLFTKLGLWKYTILPACIGLLVGGGIIALAYYLSDNIGAYISDFWPFDFWVETIRSIANFIGGVLIAAVGIVLYKHIVMALAAPFMTPISEKIEMHLTGRELDVTDTAQEYIGALLRALRINLRNIIFELLITAGLLILSLLPVIGIFSTLFIFFVGAFYAGFGNMDYTLERHAPYKQSIAFVNKHRGVAVGNGTIFTLLLMIPIFGICLALPFSAAAATINTIEKIEEFKKKKQQKEEV